MRKSYKIEFLFLRITFCFPIAGSYSKKLIWHYKKVIYSTFFRLFYFFHHKLFEKINQLSHSSEIKCRLQLFSLLLPLFKNVFLRSLMSKKYISFCYVFAADFTVALYSLKLSSLKSPLGIMCITRYLFRTKKVDQ